jgi:hypothetical protein
MSLKGKLRFIMALVVLCIHELLDKESETQSEDETKEDSEAKLEAP